MSEDKLPTIQDRVRASELPSTAPDGTIMVNASKYARQAVLVAFELIGGTKALAEWAVKSDENQRDFYTKIFTKTIQKDVEVGQRDDVEGLLAKLDKQQAANPSFDDDEAIDADFEEIPPEWKD